MGDPLIEQRQILRAVANYLAEPLADEARDRFLANAEATIARSCPAPGRAQMRAYLAANVID